MRRKFIEFTNAYLEDFIPNFNMPDFLGKHPRKAFLHLFIEPKFPKDARIVEITWNYQYAMCTFIIESQKYPDVNEPTKLVVVCHKKPVWNIPEKVEFT